VLVIRHEGRNIVGSSTIEFVTTTQAPKPPPPGIEWPMYGHDPARLRVATGVTLEPPFRKVWTFHAKRLVEFPPAIAYGRLFFANNDGVFFAVDAKTGKGDWHYTSHRCQAMSPAVAGHLVFATFLNPPPCNASGSGLTGQVIAFDAETGKVRWSRTIGPSETSPLVRNGTVYVGDWNGRVWALSQETGRVRWTFQAGGQVKGGIAAVGNRLYFGAYDAKVYSLNASTGKLIWTADAQPRLGHSASFYSTPAVAYDRVYIGGTDDKIYSFGASTGKLRWSRSTGGYVYSSPAVWHETIYSGSYDGYFYALNAATGQVRWRFKANGPISGSPTVVSGIVYFATLKGRTYGVDATSGKLVWSYPDGKYSPVVADDTHLYLVGYTRLYGFVGKGPVRSTREVRHHRRGRVHRVSPG